MGLKILVFMGLGQCRSLVFSFHFELMSIFSVDDVLIMRIDFCLDQAQLSQSCYLGEKTEIYLKL